MSDTPPFHIERGALKDQGICDGLVKQIERQNPEVTFETLIMPEARISKMLDAGDAVCFPCMIHRNKATSRAKYSVPTHLYPPFVVMTTQKNKAAIEKLAGNPVDIVDFMYAKNFVFGKEVARKYGELQKLIQNAPAFDDAKLNFEFYESTTAVVDMLVKNKIDYTIDYETTAHYLRAEGAEQLVTLPIKQSTTFIKGAIGCAASSGNYANKALTIINKTLNNEVLQSDAYHNHLDRWMSGTANYWVNYNSQILAQ